MRESRLYGSVRGVAGDRYPYRDSYFFMWCGARGINRGPAGWWKLAARRPRDRSPEETGDWGVDYFEAYRT